MFNVDGGTSNAPQLAMRHNYPNRNRLCLRTLSTCAPTCRTRPSPSQTVALRESQEKELTSTHAALKQLRGDKAAVDDELAGLKSAHQVRAGASKVD
jgi:hypothetical protein